MIRILPILMLLACDPLPSMVVDQPLAEPELVQQALDASRPGPILALQDRIGALAPIVPEALEVAIEALEEGIESEVLTCPRVDVLEVDALGAPVRELWTGGCTLPDGAQLDGFVEIHSTDTEQWMAGEGLSITRDGELELYFDGAIEAVEQDELLLIEAAATWCGGPEAPCADAEEILSLVTVDLTYSIYPAAGYPDAYDITVRGVVSPDAPIAVEGSWSVNLDTCAMEPTDGAFALQRGERHDLGMDGALSCDGCVAWTVQGLDAPPYCGIEL